MCEGLRLILRQVSDFFLNSEILWKLDASVLLFNLLFIKLKNADHGLAFNLGIPIDDHIQSILHRANTLAVQLLHTRKFVLFEIDVLRSTDAPSLIDNRSVLLDGNFESVCERLIATLLLNAGFDNSTLSRLEADKGLRYFTLFEVLSLWEFDWNHSQCHGPL